MSRFNEGAKKNASRDKTPILLMDYAHLYNRILNGDSSLQEVIRRIHRHAAQTGSAYLHPSDF
jgi:CRISPR/Cas system-associated protein endoribonuclease Cas2